MYHWQGAHLEQRDGVDGTRFAVWAPNAEAVSVLCDANGWKPGRNLLYGSDSGVWNGFVPGLGHGATYKYGIRTRDGRILEKSDPLAFASEQPPKTASIVYDLSGHEWKDGDWLDRRQQTDWLKQPIAVYEVHLGSWKRPQDGRRYYSYRELAHMLVDYAHEMGYTHLQLMPITEYPFDGSWGYQATGYFAPTSRYGTPHDFMEFVDHCHQANIGVLIDWVPAHFPTDGHSLGQFDGTALYEHADPRKGFHPDWGTPTSSTTAGTKSANFLLSSARFWVDSTTSTASASTRSPRCCTSITRASRASGFPTSTAAAKTSKRSSSSSR
jgi:1,4-alpha-glucan branching enzyme